MNSSTLATSATLQGIRGLIVEYYGSAGILLEPAGPNEWNVHRHDRKIDTVIVRRHGGRYRFELRDMPRPAEVMTLNLRTGTAQAGLLGDAFDGEPVKASARVYPPEIVSLFEDRPTATRCVPIIIAVEDTQGDLFDA